MRSYNRSKQPQTPVNRVRRLGHPSTTLLVAAVVILAMLIVALGGPEPADAAKWQRGYASAYGPKFYGNRTACGITLRRRTVGVAHRTLPCFTLLRVCHATRCADVPVIDRGPFVRGRTLDLTEGTTRRVWRMGAFQWGHRRVRFKKLRGPRA